MKVFWALIIPLSAGATSCNSVSGEQRQRVIGVIDAAGTSFNPLVTPDTVRAGVPFAATVATFGSSCLHPDGAEARVVEGIATITPYDLAPPPGSVCPGDFRAFPRVVTVTFASAGEGIVRLRGRGFQIPMLTLEDTVTIQP